MSPCSLLGWGCKKSTCISMSVNECRKACRAAQSISKGECGWFSLSLFSSFLSLSLLHNGQVFLLKQSKQLFLGAQWRQGTFRYRCRRHVCQECWTRNHRSIQGIYQNRHQLHGWSLVAHLPCILLERSIAAGIWVSWMNYICMISICHRQHCHMA